MQQLKLSQNDLKIMKAKPKVHFIGIGGIGTSALARWFLSQGYKVSGSDAFSSSTTKELQKEGIRVFIGHRAQNLPKNARMVVFSAAIPKDNPELRAARQLGIPIKSYAQTLGDLVVNQYKTIAIAGAHGKGTTTSLLSLVLIKAGFDPTVIVGTKLKEFRNSNFRSGRGDYLLLEADEYHDHFLNYSPAAAIITNIDREHLDYYKNLSEIKNAFLKFINNVRPGGILVVNKDDKNLFSLKNKIQKIAKKQYLKVYWYSIRDENSKKIVNHLRKILKISGEHNISNALAVYVLSRVLGVKEGNIFNALNSYRGAWRRMEYRGNLKTKNLKLKTEIYDDYAHHPTEIKATLSGIAQKWTKAHLICVFQPHQAKRLRSLFKEFITAFDDADSLILFDIYKVPGRDKVSQNISSEILKRAIERRLQVLRQAQNRKKHPKIAPIRLKTVLYLPSPNKLKDALKKLIQAKSLTAKSYKLKAIVVMMGAGDIYQLTNSLIK